MDTTRDLFLNDMAFPEDISKAFIERLLEIPPSKEVPLPSGLGEEGSSESTWLYIVKSRSRDDYSETLRLLCRELLRLLNRDRVSPRAKLWIDQMIGGTYSRDMHIEEYAEAVQLNTADLPAISCVFWASSPFPVLLYVWRGLIESGVKNCEILKALKEARVR